ncbi:MAG: translation initiation factor IF-2 [Parcubacteria group bacterium LiPW_15]|nr:MAG: translation initiation factor IF-2 [Parcubacteria group bacterium LiPW_15]
MLFGILREQMAENNDIKPRQPIVAVMGHVDHGKTTLLDCIRKTVVASREAGGITQAVGAYEVTHNGKLITFIDTPGHEAFSKMRERGANAADLAILVVAAEEGVKPQTKEVIKTLADTKTPFVVAINKIDKPGADIEKTKNDLMAAGVYLEGYGGDVSFEPISAKTGENVDKLLDLILLAAEVAEIKADYSAPARGFILESKLNKNRGIEVTAIIRDGVLRHGDEIATASAKGKAKIMEDFAGKTVNEVMPGAPVVIIGFEESPMIGEDLFSGEEAASNYKKTGPAQKAINAVEPEDGSLPLLLKASDAGSLEAIAEILKALPLHKPVKIVDQGVGEVGEGDLKMAISSHAAIVAYKTKLDRAAKNLAEARETRILSSEIIYELVKAVEDLSKETAAGKIIGDLEVLAVFNQIKLEKQLVGGKVISGIFKNKTQLEIQREGKKVGEGRVNNLQTKKQDAVSIPEGQEGGVLMSSAIAVLVGDHLLIREKKEV